MLQEGDEPQCCHVCSVPTDRDPAVPDGRCTQGGSASGQDPHQHSIPGPACQICQQTGHPVVSPHCLCYVSLWTLARLKLHMGTLCIRIFSQFLAEMILIQGTHFCVHNFFHQCL